jgi:curved DNA-binding protein CbpA
MAATLALSTVDHYRTFGLDPSAGFEAVQGAYRILARHLHPDINPTTTEAMRRANVAFDALRSAAQPAAAAEFTLDPTPVLRRAQSGFDPLTRYREVMASSVNRRGMLVDILA